MLNYWVYILYCDNGSYYTGYTTNLLKRYEAHVTGTANCKYTRSFKPLCIAQCWQIISDKATAMKIERYIKQLSREEKKELIDTPAKLKTLFDGELNRTINCFPS